MYCINYYNSTTLTCNYTYRYINQFNKHLYTLLIPNTPRLNFTIYAQKQSIKLTQFDLKNSILDEYCHFISSLWSHQETNSHYLVRHFSILCYLPKELRKSEIFLMLPVMTSMYSRLAQSCWIGLWWL